MRCREHEAGWRGLIGGDETYCNFSAWKRINTLHTHLSERLVDESFGIMDPSTTTPADVTIATIVDELARDFISLADALTQESRFAGQVPPTAVYDEFCRFKLWAGNIAAHRKGRRSLEYR
jgi:hypothetical protein